MWEAKAAEGRADDLLAWVLAKAPQGGQVYCSADRVVLITETASTERAIIESASTEPAQAVLPEPPDSLVARPAQAWEFERVR
jgi:hypothetical protein